MNIIKLIDMGTSYAIISKRYGIQDQQCVTSIRISYQNTVYIIVQIIFYALYDLLIMCKKFGTAVSKMFVFTSLI